MCLIASLLIIPSTLFQGAWTASVTGYLNDHEKATALLCIQPGNQSRIRSLPRDIFDNLLSYIPIDDWSRPNLVFNLESPKLQPLRQWVKENRNKIITNRSFRWTHPIDSFHGSLKVKTGENGNIVEISANSLELNDDDILDLSVNDLTKLDLRNPPRNLALLFLGRNQLTRFNINNAPKTLRMLNLEENQLHKIDISSLKGIPWGKGMPMELYLVGNPSDLEVISTPPFVEGQWKSVMCSRESEKCFLKVHTGDPSDDNFIRIYKSKRPV